MGGCLSSNSVPAKDPEDKTLDDVDMVWTWVPDFDSVFTTASEPLNTAVTLNNGIITSLEKIKEAAAAIFGGYIIKVEFASNQVHATVCSVNDDGQETELTAEQLQEIYGRDGGADFRTAWTAVTQQQTAVNNALANAPQVSVEVKKARLFFTVGESKAEDEANISTARGSLAGFNNTVFRAKLTLTTVTARDALNPKRALLEIFTNIKKHVSDFVPRIDVDLAALADGNARFDVRPPEFDVKVLPHKIRVAFLAIFDDSSYNPGLIATIKETIEQVAGLKDQFTAAQEALQSLPTDPSAMSDAAKAAGLSITWVARIPGRMATNTTQIGRAPAIMQQLLDTIRGVIEEVQGAVAEIP